jgi:hypothetical protein
VPERVVDILEVVRVDVEHAERGGLLGDRPDQGVQVLAAAPLDQCLFGSGSASRTVESQQLDAVLRVQRVVSTAFQSDKRALSVRRERLCVAESDNVEDFRSRNSGSLVPDQVANRKPDSFGRLLQGRRSLRPSCEEPHQGAEAVED